MIKFPGTTAFKFRKNRLITSLFGFLYILIPIRSQCQYFPVTEPQANNARINYSVEVLKDSADGFKINEIAGGALESKYTPAARTKFDATSKIFWLRIRVKSRPGFAGSWILKIPYIDTATLYQQVNGRFLSAATGANIPFAKRPVRFGEFPCLQINISDTFSTFYLKLTSVSRFSLQLRSLKSIEFISPQNFEYQYYTYRYFHGIFLGIMVAMILFNLIIFMMYGELSYLAFSLFLLTHTFWHLSITGFLQEFILGNFPLIAKHLPYEIAGISLLSYIFFSQVYLESRKHTPGLHKIYNWVYFIVIADVVAGYFTNISITNNILFLLGIVASIFPLIISVISYRRGFRPAIYFLIASILSYIAYFVFVMMHLKLLPDVFMTHYSLQFSIALQALLFATGLADKMNLIRKELEHKKLEQALLEKEQEIAIKKILEKQNEELELKVSERTEKLEEKNREVENDRRIIQYEREKSDRLLLNILPEGIANRLKSGEEMIAEKFDSVTVFFSDIVGFTQLSQGISPKSLVGSLNEIFTEFDRLSLEYGLEKIKTIGDGYMCVCGLPEQRSDHAKRVAKFALSVRDVLKNNHYLISGKEIEVRMGINSGTVVAGVIGKQKFAYDLWGETVNIASRMESQGISSKIQCSESTFDLLKNEFEFEERGDVNLKGIGDTKTWFLLSEKRTIPISEI